MQRNPLVVVVIAVVVAGMLFFGLQMARRAQGNDEDGSDEGREPQQCSLHVSSFESSRPASYCGRP